MTISGARKEELMREVIDKRIERIEEVLRNLAEEGPPIPGKKKTPAERLAGYMRMTMPQEISLVLDPDYEVKLSLGLYPQLQSPFWNLLLSLPRFKSGWSPFKFHVDDFRKLLLTLEKRIEKGQQSFAQPVRSGY